MIYTVTFNPAIDCVIGLEDLKVGSVNRCASQELFFGGKGINVSYILSELECPNTALGFIAGFTGQALNDALSQDGINSDFIELPSGATRINVKLKGLSEEPEIAKQGVETAINGSGPEVDSDSLEKLHRQLDKLVETDIVVITGGIPKNLGSSTYADILGRLDGRGIPAVVDTTGDLLMNALVHHPFLIKPNDEELGEIIGIENPSRNQLVKGAQLLQEKGAQNVLLSRGGDGSLLLDANGTLHEAPVIEGALVNSVGAGDSMLAGFVAGYWRVMNSGGTANEAYDEAFKLAQACGSATAFSAGLAKRSLIDELRSRLI